MYRLCYPFYHRYVSRMESVSTLSQFPSFTNIILYIDLTKMKYILNYPLLNINFNIIGGLSPDSFL